VAGRADPRPAKVPFGRRASSIHARGRRRRCNVYGRLTGLASLVGVKRPCKGTGGAQGAGARRRDRRGRGARVRLEQAPKGREAIPRARGGGFSPESAFTARKRPTGVSCPRRPFPGGGHLVSHLPASPAKAIARAGAAARSRRRGRFEAPARGGKHAARRAPARRSRTQHGARALTPRRGSTKRSSSRRAAADAVKRLSHRALRRRSRPGPRTCRAAAAPVRKRPSGRLVAGRARLSGEAVELVFRG
jgi:hypothetical protein